MKATIHAGACGFKTTVSADADRKEAKLKVESQCPHITKMAESLGPINVMDELFKKGKSQIIAASHEHLPHVACPVASGMLKVVEASSKMALPKDATITFEDAKKN